MAMQRESSGRSGGAWMHAVVVWVRWWFTRDFSSGQRALQIPPLRSSGASPDFLWRPVAPMNCMRFSLKENRTRGPCQQREAGNPGPVGMPSEQQQSLAPHQEEDIHRYHRQQSDHEVQIVSIRMLQRQHAQVPLLTSQFENKRASLQAAWSILPKSLNGS